MLAIDESALEREIDKTGGDAVLPDRDLAQHERLGARRLQQREDVAYSRIEGVDLVEEQHVRDAAVLELLENDLQRRHALGVGLANDHGRIAGRQRGRALVLKLDRSGAVDERELVAQ